MTDRDKVIKGLTICYNPPSKCDECPYYTLPDEQSCNDILCLDALELLKEAEGLYQALEQSRNTNVYLNVEVDRLNLLLKKHEAVEPTVRHGNWVYQCGKCKAIIDCGDKFCRQCGHEVKWYD